MDFLDLGNEPFPEAKWFGVRIIHAEDPYSLLRPEEHDAAKLLPELLPVIVLKLQGVDVFILLGRIFGVLHGPVGTPPEPFGMSLDIGMIWRTLKGEVKGDLQTMFSRPVQKPAEVIQGSEFGMNRFVTACIRSNCPWASRIACGAARRVILAFPMALADRMNGRQIQHIESHG